MAKPISPSYPVTGAQAKELVQEIERTSKGEVDPEQKRVLDQNLEKAIHFFRNAAAILSSSK